MCLTNHVSDRFNDDDKNLNKPSVVSTFMSTFAVEYILKNDSYYNLKAIDSISFKSPIKAKTKTDLKRQYVIERVQVSQEVDVMLQEEFLPEINYRCS